LQPRLLMWFAKWVVVAKPNFWCAQVLGSCDRYEPSKHLEGL
jgi:hypothetical protein